MTSSRQTLSRQHRNLVHRRVVMVGVGVSVVLHGAVFGAMSFRTDELPGSDLLDETDRSAAPFEVLAMEIVEIRETPEVMPEVVASNLPVVTTPAPVERPEPAESSRGAAAASASEIAALTLDEILGAAMSTSANLSMRPRFAVARNVGGAFEAVALADPRAGLDQGDEDEEDEGEGFWDRLGDAWGKVALGSGGGKVCKPPVVMQPPVVNR